MAERSVGIEQFARLYEAKRVLAGITAWIEKHLRLKVNEAKSGAGRPWERKFLGLRLEREGQVEAAPESVERFKRKVREIWRSCRAATSRQLRDEWRRYVRGWLGVLPADGTAACDFRAGRMGAAAHSEMLLAALARRNGTPARLTPQTRYIA